MEWTHVHLVIMSIAISIVAHKLIRGPFLAFIIATLVTVAIPPTIDFVRIGYMDPWWPIACVFMLLPVVPAAIITGVVIRKSNVLHSLWKGKN